jgi:hypothetical protein
MTSEPVAKWIPQTGVEWLPTGSPARKLNWLGRMRPVRIQSIAWSKPTDYLQCFNCFEEAVWYCDHCKMQFCRFDECKEVHEYEHSLSRLGGTDEAGVAV